jgi:hypothetical protein
MTSSPPPKLLKSCLIIFGSLAFIGLVTFVLLVIGFSMIMEGIFHHNTPQSLKKAMTWRVLNNTTIDGKKYALFGSDNLTNPYQGDTDINEVRSLLCIQKNNLPAPLGLPTSTTTPGGALRGSWSGGRVLIVPNIPAKTLTSQSLADEKCRLQGLQITGENGFRMAEFHDGDKRAGLAGWDFWAEVSSIEGLDNSNIRYWVQINDQPANSWSTLSAR